MAAQTTDERIKALLAPNKEYQKTHTPAWTIESMRADPNRQPIIVIVSCMDPRNIPEQYLNFGVGGAGVFRNAGGRTRTALESIAVLNSLAGVAAVLVIHHTDCGATHTTNEKVRSFLKERDPEHAAHIDATDFGEITDGDHDAALQHDVELVRASPWFSKEMVVRGYLYDIKTGEVTERVS